jgi:GNAT superfamily N-acetyltransferase
MKMKLQNVKNVDYMQNMHIQEEAQMHALPNFEKIELLSEENSNEVMEFLKVRPVHTVVMSSFIKDNGIESENNRGKFYSYRNSEGKLEGVALIGHTTLVEAHTEEALVAFALTARTSETPIKVMMSDGKSIERFWKYFALEGQQPTHNFTELLFELNFPFLVQKCEWNVRPAKAEELLQVAQAQAEVAFIESGIDPMEKDREGFLARCLRRIEQGRTFVVFEDGKLVFKVDVVAETDNVAYLEGYYVAKEMRGNSIGSKCLAKVGLDLLDRVENVCGLSNIKFEGVHRSLAKAGFKNIDSCQTIFV